MHPSRSPDGRNERVTRYRYLLVKHTGRAVAQSAQYIMIGVVVLVVLPQLPRFAPPETGAAALAFTGALGVVIVGRALEFWGEIRAHVDHYENLDKHYDPTGRATNRWPL